MLEVEPRSANVSDKGRIKGVPIQHFLAWWEETRGVSRLPPLADALEKLGHGAWLRPGRPALGLLPSVWYPAEFVHDLLDHLLVDEPPGARRDLAVEAADHTMSRILSGVYRAVFSMLATPERYPRYAQRIWDMHYDSGTLEFVRKGPCEHESTFHGWRAHHPFICMLNVQSARAIYGSMGCAQVEVEHFACVSRGAPRCASTVRWQPKA